MPSYQEVVLADRPRAYWPLTELSGTVARDLSGHGYDGVYTNTGGFTYGSGSCRAGGARGLKFSSTAYMAPASGSRQSVGDFSREMWVNNQSATDQFLVAQYGAANGEDYWLLYNSGTYRVFAFIGGGFAYDQNAIGDTVRKPQDGRCHHLAYTRANGGKVRVYWDGYPVVDASGGTSAGTLVNTVANYVGRAIPDGSNEFIGTMSDVAIYDYALSASQVLNHFMVGSGRSRGTVSGRSRMR